MAKFLGPEGLDLRREAYGKRLRLPSFINALLDEPAAEIAFFGTEFGTNFHCPSSIGCVGDEITAAVDLLWRLLDCTVEF